MLLKKDVSSMDKKHRGDNLYKKRLLVMIFINICPVFHWMRNNKRILHFYYYVCRAELEKVKDRDSEILDELHKDLLASKDSFDKLFALANFMNSREYKELVRSAPRKKRRK